MLEKLPNLAMFIAALFQIAMHFGFEKIELLACLKSVTLVTMQGRGPKYTARGPKVTKKIKPP